MRLTIGLAYYRNSSMLQEQYRVWASYPAELKSQIEVIVIDDGSPEPAADVPRPSGLPALTIGRLAAVADPFTPPWRQDAARNRAAYESRGDWLFLSDMDHVLPAESVSRVFALLDGPDVAYSFQRLDAPNLTPKLDKQGRLHPHPNTYLLTKSRYWQAGGYDETLCGIYGTDGPFKKALLATCPLVHLADVPIVRYPREVIPDASTRVDRTQFKASREPKVPPVVLSIPWCRQVAA